LRSHVLVIIIIDLVRLLETRLTCWRQGE